MLTGNGLYSQTYYVRMVYDDLLSLHAPNMHSCCPFDHINVFANRKPSAICLSRQSNKNPIALHIQRDGSIQNVLNQRFLYQFVSMWRNVYVATHLPSEFECHPIIGDLLERTLIYCIVAHIITRTSYIVRVPHKVVLIQMKIFLSHFVRYSVAPYHWLGQWKILVVKIKKGETKRP